MLRFAIITPKTGRTDFRSSSLKTTKFLAVFSLIQRCVSQFKTVCLLLHTCYLWSLPPLKLNHVEPWNSVSLKCVVHLPFPISIFFNRNVLVQWATITSSMLEEINTLQPTACTSFGSPRKLPCKTVLNGFKLFRYRFRLFCRDTYTKTKWLEP